MPRATFGIGNLNAAAPGLSRLAASLAGGDQAYQQGFDQAATGQSKIALALAQIHNQNSEAGLHDAMAGETRAKTGVLDRRPALYEEQAANAAGTDIPTIQGFRSQMATGQAPQVPMGPPTEGGQMGVGSMVLPDATRSKIAGALQQFLPLLSNSGDLNPEQLAKAAGIFRENNLSDAIINGTADRNRVGGAQAAVAGKDIYKTDAGGGVLDQYTGGLATDNPLARSTISLRGAQAGEASAKGSLAREQAKDVTAGKWDPTTGTIIDVRTGTARPVISTADGKPIAGKGGSLNQEQANALTFASRMQAAEALLEGAAQRGTTKPGGIKQVTQGVLGAVPLIGSALENAGGAATNWTQSNDQQSVEQAQRDFINAVLRRESGAAISSGEFANAAQQYFPQTGDSKSTIAQKSASRKRVIQGMLAAVPVNQRTLPDLPGVATPAQAGAGKPIVVDY